MPIPIEDRKLFYPGGLGIIRKFTFGKGLKAMRRNSKRRPLADEEINQFLKAGFRVHDKQRGIYVHG